MADNNEKLERLRRQIQAAAENDAKRILDEADKYSDAVLAEEQARLEKEHGGLMLSASSKFEAEERKRVSQARYEADRKVLMHRNRLVGQLFDEIRSELESFTASKKYENYLKRCAEDAVKQTGDIKGAVIRCRRKDEKLVRGLFGAAAEIKTDSSINIGGLMFGFPGKGIFIDLTLDTAFENSREEFSSNAQMQL